MRTLTLAALTLALLAPTAGAGEHRLNGASIQLPDDWVAMPADVLKEMNAEVSRRTGQSVQYVHGFHLGSQGALEYPYALVQVHGAQRISLDEVARNLGPGFKQALDDVSAKNADLMSNLAMGQVKLDERRKMVLVGLEMEVVEVGKVRGITAMCPGRQNMIQLNFYTVADEADRDFKVFEAALDSFKFDEGRGYSPRPNRVLTFALIGAAVGGLVGLVQKLKKRG